MQSSSPTGIVITPHLSTSHSQPPLPPLPFPSLQNARDKGTAWGALKQAAAVAAGCGLTVFVGDSASDLLPLLEVGRRGPGDGGQGLQ